MDVDCRELLKLYILNIGQIIGDVAARRVHGNTNERLRYRPDQCAELLRVFAELAEEDFQSYDDWMASHRDGSAGHA